MIKYLSNGINVDDAFISIEDIKRRCIIEKIKENNYGLLEIEWPSNRGFDGLVEKYVSSLKNIKLIKSMIVGKHIYFGEIAGKHSEIYGDIEESEINIITDIVEVSKFLLSNPSGHTYTHSFLYRFIETECEHIEYDDSQLTKEEYTIFNNLLNDNYK